MSDPVTDALKIAHYEPDLGRLSPSEISMAAEPEPVRDIHKRALDAAVYARHALRVRLHHGLPEIKELPNGGYDGMDGLHHREAADLINRFATASRMLWRAAELVCDVESLPDDGEKAGIVWEVPL